MPETSIPRDAILIVESPLFDGEQLVGAQFVVEVRDLRAINMTTTEILRSVADAQAEFGKLIGHGKTTAEFIEEGKKHGARGLLPVPSIRERLAV